MKSSVITVEETTGHFVENYRFKVLLASENKGEFDNLISREQNFEQDKISQNFQTQDEKQNAISAQNTQPSNTSFDASFVEELLKKTDELSGNIIKLQMQIENQETEFNRRLETEVARAHDDGVAAGLAQAGEKFDAELAILNERFASSVNKLTDLYNNLEEFIKKSEDELGSTAVNVAAQVIAKEISASSSNVAYTLAKLLMNELKEAKNITLRVNPVDANFLKDQFEQSTHVKIQSDDAINKGGVVIMSEAGNIDATLEARLEKLKSLI